MRFAVLMLVLLGGLSLRSHSEELTHSKDSLEEIKKAVGDGKAVLVDVRTKSETDISHVKDAKLIPLGDLTADEKLAASLPKDKPVYVHCQVGGRSMKAAVILKKLGIDARPLTQNVGEFEKAGFGVEKGK